MPADCEEVELDIDKFARLEGTRQGVFGLGGQSRGSGSVSERGAFDECDIKGERDGLDALYVNRAGPDAIADAVTNFSTTESRFQKPRCA